MAISFQPQKVKPKKKNKKRIKHVSGMIVEWWDVSKKIWSYFLDLVQHV